MKLTDFLLKLKFYQILFNVEMTDFLKLILIRLKSTLNLTNFWIIIKFVRIWK